MKNSTTNFYMNSVTAVTVQRTAFRAGVKIQFYLSENNGETEFGRSNFSRQKKRGICLKILKTLFTHRKYNSNTGKILKFYKLCNGCREIKESRTLFRCETVIFPCYQATAADPTVSVFYIFIVSAALPS